MYDYAKRLADGLATVILVFCGFLLAVMTGIIIMLVISRNFLNFSFAWSEELTRYLLVWLSLLGAAVLLHRNDHIALDLLPKALSPARSAALILAMRLPILGFLIILVQQSWLTLAARAGTRAPALGISISWAYAAIPIAACLMIVFTLFGMWRDVRTIRGQHV